jgi:UDP-N-acetylglucosamine diphosphorylase/glucosamine-1-phosphate N-acetyltransferase
MHICIFEDENFINFEPLTYSRPVYDLVCGITSLKEKIQREFPEAKYSLHCRKYLEALVKIANPGTPVNEFNTDQLLFINGRILDAANLRKIISIEKNEDKVYTSGSIIVAVNISGNHLKNIQERISDVIDLNLFDGIPTEEINIKAANYLWDLIYLNGEKLREDFEYLSEKNKSGRVNPDQEKYPDVNFINPDQIFIAKNVDIKPGVVLDASLGPVYLDGSTSIASNAVIVGPVCIGKSSLVKSFASITENVSIGNVCKVGGEVEESIIQSYTNKQHPGYLGHSYLGSWINLGADTNCSDLQNNYGTVKVQVNGKHIDSGKIFVGLIMGDHSKTAINTMFNTGTVVGFSCNIYGAGFPPKYIPSYSWGGSDAMREYKYTKALETAAAVFTRRDKSFNQEDEKLFEDIFKTTKDDREKRGF